jgi:protein tyrosine phosphatase (PTP) superfamily phosphohydrolase (DUF442 family)
MTHLIFKQASKRIVAVLPVILFLALLGPKAVQAGQRGLPAQYGITNFCRVNDRLLRGAQPDTNGIAYLKQLGVKSIINLRMPDDAWKAEAVLAAENGMVYTNVPMTGVGRPDHEQVVKVLGLIQSLPGPVFVHCQYGCDRTGTIIACYRIQHDRWLTRFAQKEADTYGMLRRGTEMRNYIKDFGASFGR